jgi:hypothetical protein
MRTRLSLLVATALCLFTGAAQAVSFTLDAIPAGPLTSGNGLIQFSNIQFFSPFDTVNAADVTFEVLDDGVRLSGPVSVSGSDLKNFFVLYEATSLGGGIDNASLLLDSHVDADVFGFVLATKQVIGDIGDRNPKKDKKDDDFPFGHGFDMGNFDRSTLAFLKTADWEVGPKEDFEGPFGLGRDGAIRLVEAGFAVKSSIKVIDGITVSAIKGSATWSSSENHFNTAPEPGTAALTALGLLLIGIRSRRAH